MNSLEWILFSPTAEVGNNHFLLLFFGPFSFATYTWVFSLSLFSNSPSAMYWRWACYCCCQFTHTHGPHLDATYVSTWHEFPPSPLMRQSFLLIPRTLGYYLLVYNKKNCFSIPYIQPEPFAKRFKKEWSGMVKLSWFFGLNTRAWKRLETRSLICRTNNKKSQHQYYSLTPTWNSFSLGHSSVASSRGNCLVEQEVSWLHWTDLTMVF